MCASGAVTGVQRAIYRIKLSALASYDSVSLPPPSTHTSCTKTLADVKVALSRPFDALVISYDLFAKASDDLAARKFKVIVLDEAHCIKNTKV